MDRRWLSAVVACALLVGTIVQAGVINEVAVRNLEICARYQGQGVPPSGYVRFVVLDDQDEERVRQRDLENFLSAGEKTTLSTFMQNAFNRIHSQRSIPTTTPVVASTPVP